MICPDPTRSIGPRLPFWPGPASRILAAVLLWPSLSFAQSPATWPAELTLSPSGRFVHAGQVYSSSSSLTVTWRSPDALVSRYVLVLREARSSRETVVGGDRTGTTLIDLKAGTTYIATLRACLQDDCAAFVDADSAAQGSTSEEYWRVNGWGRGFANADRLVDDGNVGSHAFVYGPWAGPSLAGKIQLYYTPMQREEKGAKIGEQIADTVISVDDAARFRGVSGYGLLRLCQPPPPGQPSLPDPQCTAAGNLATTLALFQAVPLTPEAGGLVRLYFEAQGSDGRTRILHLDSQDGYVGRDFHRGAATRCGSLSDFAPGGACEPALDIGVASDGDRGFPGLESARQFKIAYPTRDGGAWDLAPGTFMLFTTEWRSGRCSTFGHNQAFAVWNGARWTVEDAGGGCPKILRGVQAPAPVHLGGARYKLYFNRHRTPGGPGNPLTDVKPMQMIYADGAATGDASIVEFEDWEQIDAAREIHYVFADGTPLTEAEESRLDDYVMLAPTSDPAVLIMYSNMSATGTTPPFIGSAVLINP